jgi:hypothetical protein
MVEHVPGTGKSVPSLNWVCMADHSLLTWPESKIDIKERVSEVFPAIKLQNYE